MSNELNQEIQNLNNSVTSMVGKINTITSQIAKLNTEIANVSGSGGTANALLDQRGLLMDQLSQLVNISYTVNPDQTVNIYLGSNALVVNQKAYSLITGPSASSSGVDQVYLNDNPNQPLNSSTGLTNGELAGLIKAGSIDIPNYLSQLNTLAESVANAVNSQQTQGYQLNSSQKGGDFFVVPTSGAITASTIQVNPQLTIQGIAAASNPNSPNDGSNAQIIANLVYDTQSTLGNYTFSQYYTNLVGQVGNDGQHAQNQYNSANSTLQALRNARQSATGVDLNQSSAHLIQEQQSYQAAAQLVSVEQTIMTSLLQAVG